MDSAILAQIKFTPITDDYAAINAIALTKSTNDYRWMLRLILCVASWAATMVSLLVSDALTVYSAFAGAICSLIFILFFTARLWPDPEKAARQRFNVTRDPNLFTSRIVQLEELGIRATSERSNLWMNWSAINRVVLTETHLFVAANYTTFFVPLRAFSNREEFLEFARVAQARYSPEATSTSERGFAVVMKDTK